MQQPTFFLQSNELAQDVWWVAGAAIVLIIAFVLTRFYQNKQKTRADLPPKMSVVNDSNYNIDDTGMDDDRLSQLNQQEAKEVIDKMKETGQIPSQKAFNELKKALK